MSGKLDDFIGQDTLKELIQIKIRFARAHASPLPHLLLCGEKQSGKKRLAGAIAAEFNVKYTPVDAASLIKPVDLNGIFTNITPSEILMISDIDLLREALLGTLLRPVSDGCVDIVIGSGPGARTHSIEIPTFTFIGTTTKPWMVDERLRRWCILCEFERYSTDQSVRIVLQMAREQGLSLTPDAADYVVQQCRGDVGEAGTFLQKIAKHFRFAQSESITRMRVTEFMEFFGHGSLYPQSLSLAGDLQKLDGIEFEHWVADLFRKAGFRVEVTQASGDHGVDLWANIGSSLVAVQCKRWDGVVGEPVLRDLYGASTAANAKAGYLVTTGTFSQQACEFAKNKALFLVDLTKVIEATKNPKVLLAMLASTQ